MAIMSYVHEVYTVYDVVQNPHMILLCEKGTHGDSCMQAYKTCYEIAHAHYAGCSL